MSINYFIVILMFHTTVGIILPGILLMTKDRWKSKDRVYRIASWMLFSWTSFFTSTVIYLVTNYVSDFDLASVVILSIGIIPFSILAIASLYFAVLFLRKSL